MKRPVVAAIVTAAALLLGAGRADAHELVVVCDEATGELVWSNTFPEDGPATAVTDNGLTVSIPAEGTVSTPHPGPGTWTATWEGDFVVSGDLPPECVESTTTTPAPTTVPDTVPPTSEAGSNTIAPPSSTSSSDTLPSTGSGGAAAGVGVLLLAGGVVATVAARRRPASS